MSQDVGQRIVCKDQLEEYEKIMLADYISENWSDFVRFANNQGENAYTCDELYKKLRGGE